MNATGDLAPLLEGFFTRRLIAQRRVSPHTLASYRDTFRLLLTFAGQRISRPPSNLMLDDLNAEFVGNFLNHLESGRKNSARSRNLRLTAIRSFFSYAAVEAPQHSALIQRVLAIPRKRHVRSLIDFLTHVEMEAILAAIGQQNWIGRRDYLFLLIAMQTGLRLSELTGLRQIDVEFGAGAHVRCVGKGRKERCTPLTKSAAKALSIWVKDQGENDSQFLFPSVRSGRLSADAVQHLVRKYAAAATKVCPSIAKKNVTPHVLRHSAAMELLQAGVDRSMIAIWLGHESVETTQVYLDANLAIKREILEKTRPVNGKLGRYRPGDRLLRYLQSL
jgi:site-specific recombinase XerD